ncbi:MAG: hypothetical protein LBC27_02650, partial [Spirochaetaceae bacterium]|nr:hypothetical protein [Spirochaetaceae bacterium]
MLEGRTKWLAYTRLWAAFQQFGLIYRLYCKNVNRAYTGQGIGVYFFTVMKEKRGYSEGISMDIGKLKEKLEMVTDPRRQRGNLRH